MPDPHAPSPDALDSNNASLNIAIRMVEDCAVSYHIAAEKHSPAANVRFEELLAARAAVRRLAEQGEVYEVRNIKWGAEVLVIYREGGMDNIATDDKVRVIKIEERI